MNHKAAAVDELLKGRALANQLKILIQGDGGSGAVNVFVTKILESINKTLSIVNSGEGDGTITGCQSPVITQESSPSSDHEIISVDSKDKTKIQIKGSKDRRGGYKRRKSTNSWTEVAAKPVEDGFGWRKYGQKPILNSNYPRNYFRCTHKTDQGCQATKQVQKIGESPPVYQTTYIGHHTCKNSLKAPQFLTNSNDLLCFKPNSNVNPTHQDNYPLVPTFPSIKLEPQHDQMASTQDRYLTSAPFIYSSDFEALKVSEPAEMLASSPGSDMGDVISSVCPDPQSSDLDWMLGNTDFVDEFVDEDFFLDLLCNN